jgi:hypothetical protein
MLNHIFISQLLIFHNTNMKVSIQPLDNFFNFFLKKIKVG